MSSPSLLRRLLELVSFGAAGGSSAPLPALLFSRPTLERLEDRRMMDANPATIPTPGPGWVLDAEVAVQQIPRNNPNIVFLGDSITAGFAYGDGAAVWQQFFAPLGALDLAVSGQRTQNVLFQLQSGLLWGTNPSVVVLMIGTNNLFADGQAPEPTAEGVLADVQAIHTQLPLSQILVLGVPPSTYIPAWETAQTNAWTQFGIAQLPYAKQVTYADVGAAFLQADGSIAPYVLFDGLHPSAYGYALETRALYPALYQAELQANPFAQPALQNGSLGEAAAYADYVSGSHSAFAYSAYVYSYNAEVYALMAARTHNAALWAYAYQYAREAWLFASSNYAITGTESAYEAFVDDYSAAVLDIDAYTYELQ